MKTIKTIFSITLLLGFLYTMPAYADEIEDKTWQQNEIIQSINAKQLELDQLSNEYTEAILSQKQLMQDIRQNKRDIKKIKKKIKKQKAKLSKQCNITYKVDDSSLLDIILNSENFTSLISNVNFCQRFVNKTSTLLNKTKNLESKLKEKEVQQKQKKKELETRLQEIKTSKNTANTCIVDLQNQYNNLDEEIAILIIQQQIAAEQASAEKYDTYIEENAADALRDGDVAEDIYQIEAEETKNETEKSVEEYDGDKDIAEDIYQIETEGVYQVEAEEVKTKNETEESVEKYNSDAVTRAYSMLGTPYSWGGTTSAGFDCSGFVSYCLTGEEGTRLGTTETFVDWTQVSDPQPGDICVVHNDSSQHTGIYVGDGKMVHAATYGVGVVEGDVQDDMIYVRYAE